VGRLLVVTLLGTAFGGWWWMLQRTLANEQDAVTGRLETELQARFDRALQTVRTGLDRDRATALEAVESDPANASMAIEAELLSAVLEPEPEFAMVEGKLPDRDAPRPASIAWGSTAEGRDPVLSSLLRYTGDPDLRPILRARLLGKDGPPMKASFWSRSIERYLEAGHDPVLAGLGRAQAWRAAERMPDEGLTFRDGERTLWWSDDQILERFESAGATVTLGADGQSFAPWPTPVRAALVVPDLAGDGFAESTRLVRWVGIGCGLLFAVVVAAALWTGWRDRRLARLRTDLAASFAHELRTPLAGQRLLLDSLLSGLPKTPGQEKHYLQRARRSNQRLGSLAEQFLTFSRLDRGVLRIERSDTNVRELVEEILGAREQDFDETLIEVPDSLVAFVDRDALGSIIGNLVENAWKYSPEEKWLAVRASQGDAQLLVEVEDHGLGLDAKQQRRVFRQFWRADTGLDRKVDGLGLGLTIVARLAEAHGGRIELESTPGQGSVFRVILPESAP
jgi:signal transduction histidine kinase